MFGPQIIEDKNHGIYTQFQDVLKEKSSNLNERYSLLEKILTSTIHNFDYIVGNPP